jgi:hypothetical protein
MPTNWKKELLPQEIERRASFGSHYPPTRLRGEPHPSSHMSNLDAKTTAIPALLAKYNLFNYQILRTYPSMPSASLRGSNPEPPQNIVHTRMSFATPHIAHSRDAQIIAAALHRSSLKNSRFSFARRFKAEAGGVSRFFRCFSGNGTRLSGHIPRRRRLV